MTKKCADMFISEFLKWIYLSSNIFYLDGRQLKFLKKEINFSSDTLNFIFDGTQICVDLPKSRKETYNNNQNQNNEYVQNH